MTPLKIIPMIFAVIRRDLRIAWSSGAGLPIIFFLLVATLYPFGVGANAVLLSQTGGGILWIAALLAALLPIDRLIAPDVRSGVIDQFVLRGISDEVIITAKMIAHWLSFGPLLMIATIPASVLLQLDFATIITLETGLLLGTPGLAALSLMIASLIAGLTRGGAVGGLLMLPLAVPILIFGAGSLVQEGDAAFKLLGAVSLMLCALTPFAAGAALRALRE
jgi:heme exporter protein B